MSIAATQFVLSNPFRDVPPSGWEEGILYEIWLNLIRADRYKMLLDGLKVTLQVTLGAIIIGVILGFFLALMKISKYRVLRALSTVYISVIRGIPMVLQLMIMYFVILTSPALSKVFVAVVAFGLNSAAYTAEIFRSGILSVDKGQTEAGRSVGLSSMQTMRLIIFPQALKNALPPLISEAILLLKETAIIGYIGEMDLTKAGDIIRSRTYSPFVPLFASALIYLTIVLVATWLLGKLERRLRKGDSHR